MRRTPPFTHGEVELLVVTLEIIREMATPETPDPEKLEATLREIHRRASEVLGYKPTLKEQS